MHAVKHIEQGLDQLLSEGLESAKSRMTNRFAQKLDQNKDIILYGAGNLGKQTLAGLRQSGIEPLAFIEDISNGKQRLVEGLKVLTPQEAVRLYGNRPLYLVTILNSQFSHTRAAARLAQLGISNIESFISLFWAYSEIFLPHYQFDLPQTIYSARDSIYKALELFSDQQSKSEFINHLRFRLHLDFSSLPARSTETYFRTDLCMNVPRDASFVDLGAFNGDTINLFLQHTHNHFAKIWAIEPDQANFAKLRSFIGTLAPSVKAKVNCLNLAVADQVGEINFQADANEESRYCEQSSNTVPAATLDSLFANQPVNFIKFDIEGMEQKALIGGRRLIANQKPTLAVSVYHCPDDLWQIPVYLKSLNNDYQIFLRTEGEDGMGTVCYAL